MEQMEDMEGAPAPSDADDGASEADPGDGGFSREVKEPLFPLPEPDGAPDGYERIAASCEEPEEFGAWFTYAVPADWELTGSSSGSGSPLAINTDLTFTRPDGTLLDPAGEPFVSYDYIYKVNGEPTEITFDPVDTVSVGDQEVDIVVARPDQAPDILSSTEFKARVETAKIPNPADDEDGYRPTSLTITLVHDPADGELSDDVVATVVESLAMPSCSIDHTVAILEINFNEDLDGDGDVDGAEDIR